VAPVGLGDCDPVVDPGRAPCCRPFLRKAAESKRAQGARAHLTGERPGLHGIAPPPGNGQLVSLSSSPTILPTAFRLCCLLQIMVIPQPLRKLRSRGRERASCVSHSVQPPDDSAHWPVDSPCMPVRA
jgi:hypothetical protein